MFKVAKKLREKSILGINQRNADFISKYNRRSLYPRVDEKLITKELAIKHGVAVPQSYESIEFTGEVKGVLQRLSQRKDFVVKPNRGSGGEGILVISGRVHKQYKKSNGKLLDEASLAHHIHNIISGMYSLGGHPDKVLIEQRVEPDPVFSNISYQGVPDIRIVVFFGVPVMCMLRLPTQVSEGRANLHQGAVGCGINLKTGVTQSAVFKNDLIEFHPDTGEVLSGLQIPYWDTLLELSSQCYNFTEIAYQGVDFVLDKTLGPLLLEINARPGLNIQIANRAGLGDRLRLIENKLPLLKETEAKIEFAKKNF